MHTTLTRAECQGELPCLLCGEPLPVRIAKTKKPFFVCNDCGIQIFVRRPAGIGRLHRLLKQNFEHGELLRSCHQSVAEIQSKLIEIGAIKSEINKLDKRIGLLFQDADLAQARNALKRRLDGLIRSLEA